MLLVILDFLLTLWSNSLMKSVDAWSLLTISCTHPRQSLCRRLNESGFPHIFANSGRPYLAIKLVERVNPAKNRYIHRKETEFDSD